MATGTRPRGKSQNGASPAPQNGHRKQLRLLKVNIQPVFVAEVDGELVELQTPPIPVTAKDWPDYARSSGFAGVVAAAEADFAARVKKAAGA